MTSEEPPVLPPRGPQTPHVAHISAPPAPLTPPASGTEGFAPMRRPIPTSRSGLAVAALVLGILSVPLFVFVVFGVLALVFGLVGANQIKQSNGRLTGMWMARAGWVLGASSVLVFAGLMALVATGVVGGDSEVPRDLDVGDCVRLDEDDDLVFTVPTVECSEPHNAEVIFVGQLNPSGSDGYPGDAVAERESGEQCIASWPDTVGVPYSESALDAYWFLPDKSRWKRDNGEFVCLATSFERDLTSTVIGSRR